jgi:hypothetical protein
MSNSYKTAKSNTSNYKTASNSYKSVKSKSSTPKKRSPRKTRRSKSLPSRRAPRVALPRHYPVRIPQAIELVCAIREQNRPNEEYLRRNAVRAGIIQPFPGNAVEANSRLYDPLINGQWMSRRTLRRTYY